MNFDVCLAYTYFCDLLITFVLKEIDILREWDEKPMQDAYRALIDFIDLTSDGLSDDSDGCMCGMYYAITLSEWEDMHIKYLSVWQAKHDRPYDAESDEYEIELERIIDKLIDFRYDAMAKVSCELSDNQRNEFLTMVDKFKFAAYLRRVFGLEICK